MDYLLSNSECSSGCESGWTLYLDNSFVGGEKCNFSHHEENRIKFATEEAEEDLSMVSDASSGPPHFAEKEEISFDYNAPPPVDGALRKKGEKIRKNKEIRPRKIVHEQQSSLLDDTASSTSNFKIANNHEESAEEVLDFSQGYSTTHFQGKSAYQDQYGFFHSSLSGNYLQENQWFPRRR